MTSGQGRWEVCGWPERSTLESLHNIRGNTLLAYSRTWQQISFLFPFSELTLSKNYLLIFPAISQGGVKEGARP